MQKIMFNEKYGLTTAVLQRRKTKTRRSCKDRATNELILAADVESYRYYPEENLVEFLMQDGSIKVSVPPYKIGEVVAVAQSYKDAGIDPHFLIFQPVKGSNYFAEMEIEAMFTGGWNNKMFVRADLMPLKIQITDIKVERLQDISDEDVCKEGFRKEAINNGWGNAAWHWEAMLTYTNNLGRCKEIRSESPKEAFSFLIDKVSGIGTWERNPYVFAYSFELVK